MRFGGTESTQRGRAATKLRKPDSPDEPSLADRAEEADEGKQPSRQGHIDEVSWNHEQESQPGGFGQLKGANRIHAERKHDSPIQGIVA